MKEDFEFIIKHIPKNDDLKIYPISDLHVGAKEFLKKNWKEFKRKLLSEENSYIILNGDLMNNATRMSVSNVYEDVMTPLQQREWIISELEEIKDRILAVTAGNHEKRNRDVDNHPIYDICRIIGIADIYRENMAFLKLQIGNTAGNGNRNPTYMIALNHGSGGGGMTGSVVNRNESYSYTVEGLDCLIIGHTHKGTLTYPTRLVIDKHNNKISKQDCAVISCTAWLDYGGYAVANMFKPCGHRLHEINLSGKKKQVNVTW